MARYYDNTLFSQFYGHGGLLAPVAAIPTGNAFRTDFYMMSPGTIEGIRLWNVMPGNPTLRIGLFLNGVEHVAQTRDHVAVPVSVAAPIDLAFAAPYVAGWSDLTWQRNGVSFFSIVVLDTGFNWYQTDTGIKSILPGNYGPAGLCYYPASGFGFNLGGGWTYPVSSGCRPQGMDPIILPAVDSYEPTIWPYLYGAAHPGIAVASPAFSQTIGSRFSVKRTGCLIHGVRFYTHDPNPWTAKCCIYKAPGAVALASATVNCTGAGVYDCLFGAPLTITNAVMKEQEVGAMLVATVFNTTNVKYTSATVVQVLPMAKPCEFDIHKSAATVAAAYPNYYIVGDALPTNVAVTVYPISPLVSRGV